MQITIEIPDHLALEAQARGLSLDRRLTALLAEELAGGPRPARRLSREEFGASLDALARYSDEIPSLPDEAFSRESFYEDHD